MAHYVFIMASRPGGALYTGQCSDLRACVEAHRAGRSAHTAKYNIRRLVWFERHTDLTASLQRMRAIKRWRRGWKIALITQANPVWHDLTGRIPDGSGFTQAAGRAPPRT